MKDGTIGKQRVDGEGGGWPGGEGQKEVPRIRVEGKRNHGGPADRRMSNSQ